MIQCIPQFFPEIFILLFSFIDIVYRVRGVALSCGRLVYCVWVSRDPEEMGEGGRYCGGNLTLTSSFNSTVDNSLGQVFTGLI